MVQWAVVGLYILAMFLFTRQDISSAGHTTQLLARWFPQLSAAELRHYVIVLRKLGHVLAYSLLTLLVYLAADKTEKARGRAVWVAVLAAFFVAAADEYYQTRLQHRSGAWQDVLIDLLGIAATGRALWLRARMKEKHREVKDNAEDECI